jgi:hypothetical protein
MVSHNACCVVYGASNVSLPTAVQYPHSSYSHNTRGRSVRGDRLHYKMSKKLRKLRIAFSILCGIVCLLLIGLWVRSYYYYDLGTSRIVVMRGNLYLAQMLAIGPSGTSTAKFRRTMLGTYAVPAGDFIVEPLNAFAIPQWLLVLSVLLLAVAPWLPRSRRFSLRTLLIATTLVAFVLGMVVYSLR